MMMIVMIVLMVRIISGLIMFARDSFAESAAGTSTLNKSAIMLSRWVWDNHHPDQGVGKIKHDDDRNYRPDQDVEYIGEDPNLHNRVCGLKVPSMDSLDNSIWTVEVV